MCILLVLTVEDLKCNKIMRLLRNEFSCAEADKLAMYLDIPEAKITEFKQNNVGDAERMLIAVLNHWLKTDTSKSWNKLAEAVEYCNYRVLAKEIRQKSM